MSRISESDYIAKKNYAQRKIESTYSVKEKSYLQGYVKGLDALYYGIEKSGVDAIEIMTTKNDFSTGFYDAINQSEIRFIHGNLANQNARKYDEPLVGLGIKIPASVNQIIRSRAAKSRLSVAQFITNQFGGLA